MQNVIQSWFPSCRQELFHSWGTSIHFGFTWPLSETCLNVCHFIAQYRNSVNNERWPGRISQCSQVLGQMGLSFLEGRRQASPWCPKNGTNAGQLDDPNKNATIEETTQSLTWEDLGSIPGSAILHKATTAVAWLDYVRCDDFVDPNSDLTLPPHQWLLVSHCQSESRAGARAQRTKCDLANWP